MLDVKTNLFPNPCGHCFLNQARTPRFRAISCSALQNSTVWQPCWSMRRRRMGPQRSQGADQRHRAVDLLGRRHGALRRRPSVAPLALSLNPNHSFHEAAVGSNDLCPTPRPLRKFSTRHTPFFNGHFTMSHGPNPIGTAPDIATTLRLSSPSTNICRNFMMSSCKNVGPLESLFRVLHHALVPLCHGPGFLPRHPVNCMSGFTSSSSVLLHS